MLSTMPKKSLKEDSTRSVSQAINIQPARSDLLFSIVTPDVNLPFSYLPPLSKSSRTEMPPAPSLYAPSRTKVDLQPTRMSFQSAYTQHHCHKCSDTIVLLLRVQHRTAEMVFVLTNTGSDKNYLQEDSDVRETQRQVKPFKVWQPA